MTAKQEARRPLANPASQALRETKSFTGMLRGLIALEDELGELADLERAKATRQAALAQVEGLIAARTAEASAMAGHVAAIQAEGDGIIAKAQEAAAEIDARAAANDAIARESIAKLWDESNVAIAAVRAETAEQLKLANDANQVRVIALRDCADAEAKLAKMHEDIADLRKKMGA